MFANEIYDPTSRAVNPANNLGYANPFPSNIDSLDPHRPDLGEDCKLFSPRRRTPISSAITPESSRGNRYSAIPSMKIDHNLSDKDKLSFYYSENNTQSQISSPLGNADGLPHRDRRVPRNLHSHLHGTAELRPHHDADPPAAPWWGLLSHQLQRQGAVHQLQPLGLRAHRLFNRPPVPERHGNVRSPARIRRGGLRRAGRHAKYRDRRSNPVAELRGKAHL